MESYGVYGVESVPKIQIFYVGENLSPRIQTFTNNGDGYLPCIEGKGIVTFLYHLIASTVSGSLLLQGRRSWGG